MTLENEAETVRTNSLGWMIQRIARQLDRAMESRLSEIDLNLQQFAVMMTVLETDGQTQTEIGNKFSIPPYAISRALDHLETSGHLERKPHPTSRRTHLVFATDQGRKLAPRLFAIVREVNSDLVAAFSAQEQNDFHKLLTKMM